MRAPALSVSAVGRRGGGTPGRPVRALPGARTPPRTPAQHPGPTQGPARPALPLPGSPVLPALRPDSHVSGGRPRSPHTCCLRPAPSLSVPETCFHPLHLSKSYLSSQDTPQMSFQMSSSKVIFRSYKSGRVGLPLKASVVPTELPTRPEGPARPPRRALATACPALRALLSPRGAAPPVLHEASSVSAAKSEFKYDRI